MHASSCALTITECRKHPKAAHSLPLPVFFAEAEVRGCVSFFLFECFSMIQYSKEKSFTKYRLISTEDYSDQCCNSI